MAVNPKVEASTRKMLGHSIRNELDDLAALIGAEGDDALVGAVDLCTFAAGYICIDVTGMRWPSEAMLRKIAHNASESATQLPVTEDVIFEFLSRVALGNEKADDVFSTAGVGLVPIYATANLLLTFFPKGKHWFEYLDQIWNAAEVADRISDEVLPALMLRVRKQGRLSPESTRRPRGHPMQGGRAVVPQGDRRRGHKGAVQPRAPAEGAG